MLSPAVLGRRAPAHWRVGDRLGNDRPWVDPRNLGELAPAAIGFRAPRVGTAKDWVFPAQAAASPRGT